MAKNNEQATIRRWVLALLLAISVAAPSATALAAETGEQTPDETTEEEASSEQDDYLLHEMHLPDETLQLRLALGQRFYNAIDNPELAGEFVFLRWGVTDRLNLAIPGYATFLLDESPSQRFFVTGGMQGIGFNSDGDFITQVALGGAYQHLPDQDTVWTLNVEGGYARNWKSADARDAGVWLNASLNRAMTLGDRWSLGLGVSMGNFSRAHSVTRFADDEAHVSFGAAGGGPGGLDRPLIQVRVWHGFHLYASSRLRLMIDDGLYPSHSHVGGFNWFF